MEDYYYILKDFIDILLSTKFLNQFITSWNKTLNKLKTGMSPIVGWFAMAAQKSCHFNTVKQHGNSLS